MAKDHTDTDVDAVQRPIEQANGLPNAHYIDPDVFAEESKALLTSTWAGLAVTDDVPKIGDAKPITFLGMPLLLIRDTDDQVRVFENICRHRGMILVDEPRTIEGAIRCPYHSWCYSTKGALVSTPHVGGAGHNTHPAITKSELGLNEIKSQIWMGVVFVNISGDAPAFEEVHADLIKRWQAFDQPIFHGGADSQFTLKANTNWKLAVENYCESYHLPWVHPGLNSYSRLEDHYHIQEPRLYSGQGTYVYRQLTDDDGNVFPDFKGLSDFWDKGAEYITLYPNVLFGMQRDHAYAIILEPISHDKTHEHVHIYYADPAVDTAMKTKNTALWKGVFEEDIFVVEGMQRGRHAPSFDGGRFSPAMDGPTHTFHDWCAARISAHRDT